MKKMKRVLLIILIIFHNVVPGFFSITSMNISMPSMVLIDDKASKPIYLSCQYELDKESTYLVVKWIKNNETLYHWIRGQNPSVYPKFRDDIDESYKSSSDPDREYSGISLVNPSINSSGFYKCFVQTASDTQSKEQTLQVVDIKNFTLDLYHNKVEDETHLECVVDQVYPKPIMRITTADNDTIDVISSTVTRLENGLYNGTLIAVDADGADDEEYICTVTFNELDVNLTASVNSVSSRVLSNMFFLIVVLIFGIFKTLQLYV